MENGETTDDEVTEGAEADEAEVPVEAGSDGAEASDGDASEETAEKSEAATLAEEFLAQITGKAPKPADEDTGDDPGRQGGAAAQLRGRPPPKASTLVQDLQMRVGELEVRCAELTEEVDKQYQARLRTQAEFENFRKRMQRERLEEKAYANEDLLREVLPVLDNLERALEHARGEGETGPLADGVQIVLNQFVQTIGKFGAEPFDSAGEEFDPKFHDAMSQIPSEEVPKGRIASVFTRGYTYRERLLRPAMVAVSAGPGPGGGAQPEASAESAAGDDASTDASTDDAPGLEELPPEPPPGAGLEPVGEDGGAEPEAEAADEPGGEGEDDPGGAEGEP